MPLADYARDARARCFAGAASGSLFEPGRRLVGDAGVLLTRVEYLKPGSAAQLRDRRRGDERPAAPGALRRVASGRARCGRARARRSTWEIVGPVCESGDFLAHDRDARARPGRPPRHRRRRRVRHGDELELQRAAARLRGASSTADRAHLVRRRERVADLFARRVDRCPDRADVRARARRRDARRRVCRYATLRGGPKRRNRAKSCKYVETWLQCRQQVAVGLSRGSRNTDKPSEPPAMQRSNKTVSETPDRRNPR